MNLKPMDLGVCGVEQLLHAGKVSFDTKDIANGVELIELPANMIITKAVAVVGKAFNAATTNVLTVGTNDSVDDLLGAAADYQKQPAGQDAEGGLADGLRDCAHCLHLLQRPYTTFGEELKNFEPCFIKECM